MSYGHRHFCAVENFDAQSSPWQFPWPDTARLGRFALQLGDAGSKFGNFVLGSGKARVWLEQAGEIAPLPLRTGHRSFADWRATHWLRLLFRH
jgi:hypothetical protein